MKVTPVNNEILIEPKQYLTKNKNMKLILPEEDNNIWVQAIVHAVGPGMYMFGKWVDTQVKVGDVVLLTKDLVQDHMKLPLGMVDSTNHLAKFYIIKETEVRAILEISQKDREELEHDTTEFKPTIEQRENAFQFRDK